MVAKGKPRPAQHPPIGKPSSLLDTRIIYCGDFLYQLRKLPKRCVDLIYIDPPFNSNRNYEVFWGKLYEPRPLGSGFDPPFDDRHASTQAGRSAQDMPSWSQCRSCSSRSRSER